MILVRMMSFWFSFFVEVLNHFTPLHYEGIQIVRDTHSQLLSSLFSTHTGKQMFQVVIQRRTNDDT